MTSKQLSLLSGLSLVVLIGTAVWAEDFSPEVEKEASKVFHSLMSPYCPDKLIANCPSSKAAEMREDIRERIAAGESAADIREELVSMYGETVRAAPRARGFNLLVWVLPPLAVLVGAILSVVWLRKRSVPILVDAESASRPTPAIDDEARERLEEELRRMESR